MRPFALIVCTYMRPKPLLALLESVGRQELYPGQIIVVDGSRDTRTRDLLTETPFGNLEYFLVDEDNRGLTRQRNYGIARLSPKIEIACFLDDDIVLEPDYFANLIATYDTFPDALGVGGYILGEALWRRVDSSYRPSITEFAYDGYVRRDPSRFVLRKRLGLDSDVPPGFSPAFSHGRSLGFLPPSGKIYPVRQLMGGVSSFRAEVFKRFSFSHYFEGYGLYEDADFTLRVSAAGPLYLNTSATLHHHHDPSGRPNQFNYGKMVVRNGYYVWRVACPDPPFKSIVKWHMTTWLLTIVRLGNAFSGPDRMQAFTESLGRTAGWFALLWNKPRPI